MTREYIGIDLHKAFFQACAVTATGERALWDLLGMNVAALRQELSPDVGPASAEMRG